MLSAICYGTGNFGEGLDEAQAFRMLDAFVDLGGSFIDSANVYCKWIEGMGNSSEQYIGKWLKQKKDRQGLVIATKGGHYDFSCPEKSRVREGEIRRDLEESLTTLGLNCIDLYWLHRDDEEIPIEAVMDWMERLVQEGKIRYYGASNFRQERMEAARVYAEKHGLQGFSAVSNQWSMAGVNPGKNLNPDPSLVILDGAYYQWHKEHQVPVVPFSSGAHGFFEKLYQNAALSEEMNAAYVNEKNMAMYQDLCILKESCQASLYSLSIAWLLNQPFPVFPVAAVTKEKQLEDFVRAQELLLPKEIIEKYIP